MKKLISLVVMTALLLSTLAGCGGVSMESNTTDAGNGNAGGAASSDSGDRKIVIGACVMDMTVEYMSNTIKGYEAFAEATGGQVEIIVVDGASQPEKQVEALENFINLGVDAILLNALDLAAVEDVVDRAMAAGIKVGIYPARAGTTQVLIYDEYEWGYKLGEEAGMWIAENLGGQAKVACFVQAEIETAMGRYYGYVDGVLAHNDEENIQFLEPISAIDPASGMQAMESILQAHPDVKVLLGASDASVMGGYEAINAAGMATDDFFVGGCDGDDRAIQEIAKGTIYRCSSGNASTVPTLSFSIIQNIVKAVIGEEYAEEIIAPTLAITPDNVEEYLAMTDVFELDPVIQAYFGL